MSEEEARGDLQMIEQSGYKMNAIINELLLLASVRKIEEVEMEPLAMSRIVAEAQRRLGSMIEEYQAEIVVADDWPIPLGRDQWVEEVWVRARRWCRSVLGARQWPWPHIGGTGPVVRAFHTA